MSHNQIFWLTHSKILSYKDPAVNFLADLMDWLSLCSLGLNLCKPEYLATLNLHITFILYQRVGSLSLSYCLIWMRCEKTENLDSFQRKPLF